MDSQDQHLYFALKIDDMKTTYLMLALIGFIAPNILVALESWETGNILLYAQPMATIAAMFANRIASIFMIDLLFAVLVFFIWSYAEGKRHQLKGLPWVWVATMLFGLAGGLPLFLYVREEAISQKNSS